MEDDLEKRLRRLGVVKGTENLRQVAEKPSDSSRIRDRGVRRYSRSSGGETGHISVLLPGAYLAENELGACLVLDHVYASDHRHGELILGELLELSPNVQAAFLGDQRLANMSFDEFIFLDTETTGLMGAGTFAFMVGVAFIDQEGDQPVFIVRQYFLRDQADEPAMLLFLTDLLAKRPGLITFNGRSFDLPLLDNRYLIQRLDIRTGELASRPHIDLLHPARRLWRRRIGSCSLSSLEQKILNLKRSQEDVPGWMIPGLYMDYLRSGDATELLRVFYHNRLDMLSMVVLTTRIIYQIEQLQKVDEPLDLLSLARWQNALGMTDDAESTLLHATTQEMPLEHFHLTLYEMGILLKRSGRRREAALQWQQIAATHIDGMTQSQLTLEAHVELAKYFEWQKHDLKEAHHWTELAISFVTGWETRRTSLVIADLRHRLARLERKLSRSDLVD
ncbi:MAG: ribonuclease H-like domain-containing protein [Candidatus Promineifilaceae bacterium]